MIEVSRLTKRYGSHTAISDLNFSIQKGEVYGFLGPNGAGKTTTMNILAGCLAATEGRVLIDGYDIFEDAAQAKKRIGYLPEQPPLYLDMTASKYLEFVGRAKGVPSSKLAEQLDYAIEVTQIADVADRLIKNLSKGYRQRVGIAQALIGEPELIILDEPTVGLDPIQIIEIRDLIRSLGQTHTVLLSSHILSEVRAICSKIMIISRGEIVASDTPENLERLFAGTFNMELTVEASEAEVRRALSAIPGVTELKYDTAPGGGANVAVSTDSTADISRDVFFAFCKINRPILRMSAAQASLEDVFIELTSADGAQAGEQSKSDTAPDKPDEHTDRKEAQADESDI